MLLCCFGYCWSITARKRCLSEGGGFWEADDKCAKGVRYKSNIPQSTLPFGTPGDEIKGTGRVAVVCGCGDRGHDGGGGGGWSSSGGGGDGDSGDGSADDGSGGRGFLLSLGLFKHDRWSVGTPGLVSVATRTGTAIAWPKMEKARARPSRSDHLLLTEKPQRCEIEKKLFGLSFGSNDNKSTKWYTSWHVVIRVIYLLRERDAERSLLRDFEWARTGERERDRDRSLERRSADLPRDGERDAERDRERRTGDRERRTGERERDRDRERRAGDRERRAGDRERRTGDRERRAGDRERDRDRERERRAGDRERDRERRAGDRERERERRTGDRERRAGDRERDRERERDRLRVRRAGDRRSGERERERLRDRDRLLLTIL